MQIVDVKMFEQTDLAAHGITGEIPMLLEFEDWQVPANGDVIIFDDVLTAERRPAAFVVRGRAYMVHNGAVFNCAVMLDLLSKSEARATADR